MQLPAHAHRHLDSQILEAGRLTGSGQPGGIGLDRLLQGPQTATGSIQLPAQGLQARLQSLDIQAGPLQLLDREIGRGQGQFVRRQANGLVLGIPTQGLQGLGQLPTVDVRLADGPLQGGQIDAGLSPGGSTPAER